MRGAFGVVAALLAVAALSSPGRAAEQPRYGGTLVVGVNSDPEVLNPGITTSIPSHRVLDSVFNGLIAHDFAFTPVPDLATSWTVAPDGRSYTFQLAEARWHDGQPVTSEDVKWTFEAVLLKFSSRTRTSLGANLAGVDTPSERTVVFRLKEPYAPFLKLIDVVNAPILPKHRYAGVADITKASANDEPVGTGPYRLKEWVKGDHVTLVKNEDYFKRGRPYLDRIVFKVIPDQAAATLAFERGEIDYLQAVAGNDLERLRALPGVVVTNKGREGFAGVQYLIPNLAHPALARLPVRQGIAYALDRTAILERAYQGQGRVATGPISSELSWAYSPNVTRYERDVVRANALLDGAGLARDREGVRLRLSLIYDASWNKVADLVADELKDVGVALDRKVMERNAWIDLVYVKKQFELAFTSFENGPDPDIGVKRVFVSSNIASVPFSNAAGYRNPRVDELFAVAAGEQDQGKRAAAYAEIQEIVVREAPYFYLTETGGAVAFRSEFVGLHSWSSKSTLYFADTTWWAKAPSATGLPTETPQAPPLAVVLAAAAAVALLAVALSRRLTRRS